jgi:parallel beta-helix repeat protein
MTADHDSRKAGGAKPGRAAGALPTAMPAGEPGGDIYATRPGSAGEASRPQAAGVFVDPLALQPGDLLDDFQVIATLGRGSFGTVYLAWQRSLGRRIALKVSACTGAEGRTLARLDHPHIVSVYAETLRDGLRLLCMQYVPSLPLDDLLRMLCERSRAWTGGDLLSAIDRSHAVAAEFDPAQLADRQELAGLDHVDAVCFIGSRLADALGHAHRQGVLHRDIKAGNVLVSQYGRPLLVDFNMAELRAAADGGSMFGGTVPYMAPEHLDAFNPAEPASAAEVTDRADQYSLGVLVYELATGRLPFAPPPDSRPLPELLRQMAADRRAPAGIWDDPLWREEPGVAAVLARALAPRPEDRWPSADAFAAALRDTIDLRRTLAAARRTNPLPRWCTSHPFATLVAAGVLPNLAGSAVNIPYNLLRIVPAEHEPTFFSLVNAYNLLVYPICMAILWMVVAPVHRRWRRLGACGPAEMRDLRERVVRWPRWAARIAVVGWLPATLFFPIMLHCCDCGLEWSRLFHFLVSIGISGMIALTYSMLLVACLVAWVFYPALWRDPTGFRERAARDVAAVLAPLKVLPFLAGAIPLVAAILMVSASPRSFAEGEYEAFRLLTTALIAGGMAGFQFAVLATTSARSALSVFLPVVGTAATGPGAGGGPGPAAVGRAVALAALIWLSSGAPAVAAEWHVSKQGDDAWSGRLAAPNADRTDGPLATPERARDVVRAARKAGLDEPVTVWVHAGRYELPRTLEFSKEDSGTAEKPVVWRAFGDAKPVVVGGVAVTGWRPVADDARTGGRLLVADLAAQGLGKAAFTQLVSGDRRQPKARWPDFDHANPYGGGWAYVDGAIVSMYAEVPGEDKRTLVLKPGDARGWARPADGEVFIFPRYNWWNNVVRIERFDAAARRITLAADCSYAIRPGDRYYVQGLREELDAPGEWYHDREAGRLFHLPAADADAAAPDVVVPTLATIIAIQPDTAHLTIRGLTLECCEGTAVRLANARHCSVAGCTIRNVGNYSGSGVSVSGRDNAVVGCDISHTGSHGIAIDGGDRRTLTAANNRAENNYIHHTGVFYKQGVGISLTGVGNRAAHNLIHDCPRMGIMFSGNDLAIEFNHIRHVNLETEDTGAVYTGGRDWISSRGSVIRHNFFHDILGFGREGQKWVSPHFAWGVYLDDNAGGVDVIGNIVARCQRAGIHLHNGRDNLIENNVFVDCGTQQIEYSGWKGDHPFWTSHFDSMVKGYESVAGEPAWQRMRNMKTHPRDAVLPDGLVMTGNEFRRNVVDYRDPKAKLFRFSNVPFGHYASDDNVVWHHGLPLDTGQQAFGGPIANVPIDNAGFETGKDDGMPDGWRWQIKPVEATAERTGGEAGGNVLRIGAGTAKDAAGKEATAQVTSSEFVIVPGKAYRLAATMKADRPGVAAALMVQSYVANVFFWASRPHDLTLTGEWKPVEFAFRVPAAGEPGHHAQLRQARVRIDVAGADATCFVDDVRLDEVEQLDGWAAWRKLGFDARSVAADPLFVNRDGDDFRLRPDSPALKLGFQPIPVDKIGPYRDELRATWPIVEAEGAREKPLR